MHMYVLFIAECIEYMYVHVFVFVCACKVLLLLGVSDHLNAKKQNSTARNTDEMRTSDKSVVFIIFFLLVVFVNPPNTIRRPVQPSQCRQPHKALNLQNL
jgi:hypothetical protein